MPFGNLPEKFADPSASLMCQEQPGPRHSRCFLSFTFSSATRLAASAISLRKFLRNEWILTWLAFPWSFLDAPFIVRRARNIPHCDKTNGLQLTYYHPTHTSLFDSGSPLQIVCYFPMLRELLNDGLHPVSFIRFRITATTRLGDDWSWGWIPASLIRIWDTETWVALVEMCFRHRPRSGEMPCHFSLTEPQTRHSELLRNEWLLGTIVLNPKFL
jgi:hypothetical protein